MITVTTTADDVIPDGTLVGAVITSDRDQWSRCTPGDGQIDSVPTPSTWTMSKNTRPLLIGCGDRETISSPIEWIGVLAIEATQEGGQR